MHLTHLSLTNFRAFTRLDMDVPRRILLLVGANAQGKTSLLESIYFLATFTSFQAQQDRQLLNYLLNDKELSVGRIVADVEQRGKRTRIEVRLILETNHNGNGRFRKEILLDGVKKTVQEAMGVFNSVIFLPQMTRIIEDGPEERRRFANLFISQAIPRYAGILSEYSQIVSQRNALLKQIAERNSDPTQLEFWDEMLTQRGAYMILARARALQELEKSATRIHHHLTNSKEVLRMEYRPSFNPVEQPDEQYRLPMDVPSSFLEVTEAQIQRNFQERLRVLRNEEIARGVTTIGPHRDEIRFLSNGVDLGVYGSRGQIRTALLSLKLAEAAWLREKTGEYPVLLLDEIMAELDAQRRADLISYLYDFEQVILSTTDLNLFGRDFVETNTVWEVKSGIVTALE